MSNLQSKPDINSLKKQNNSEKPDFYKMALKHYYESLIEDTAYTTGCGEIWTSHVEPLNKIIEEKDKRIAELEDEVKELQDTLGLKYNAPI